MERALIDQNFDEDDILQLVCETTSTDVKVKWYKNDQIVESEYLTTSSGRVHKLEKMKATTLDAGKYTCSIVETGENSSAFIAIIREFIILKHLLALHTISMLIFTYACYSPVKKHLM